MVMFNNMLRALAINALLGATSASSLSDSSDNAVYPRQENLTLDAYIDQQRSLSLDRILANIGPNPARTLRGVVLAGPGVVNPDYRYSWTRDSALTAHCLEEEFFVTRDDALGTFLEDFVFAEATRQVAYTPLGGLEPWGTGLGEVKFWPNLTRYNGVWGRPQRDGPALRAIALMDYIKFLLENGGEERAREVVWPIVLNDLNYVSMYWPDVGYDLWEEVAGLSFFTIQSQWRALYDGAQVARRLGLSCDNCEAQAPNVRCFLSNNFWNETGNHIKANIETPNELARSNVDAAAMLSAMVSFDVNAPCQADLYQPCSSRILATHKAWVDSFRDIYPINARYSDNAAVACGRYPEDVYYEGNPWYLTTLAAAEVLYDAAAQFEVQGQITVDETSLAFFEQIYPDAEIGTYRAESRGYPKGRKGQQKPSPKHHGNSCGTPNRHGGDGYGSDGRQPTQTTSDFNNILTAITSYADGFVEIARDFTPANGSMSEQFNRTTGEPLSATDLTWSYAAFVTMSQRRTGQFLPSWLPSPFSSNPQRTNETCTTTPVARATYAPATAAGAPPSNDRPCTVQIHFSVNATTNFGQNIFLTGNAPQLGDWAPNYLPLFTPFYPIWEAIVDVAAGSVLDYKYVYENNDSFNYTLAAANRTLEVGECGDGFRRVEVLDRIADVGPVVTEGFCNPNEERCEDTSYLGD